MRKYWYIIIVLIVFFAIVIASFVNNISYRRGYFDSSLADIPAQLSTLLQMHSMRTNLPDNVSGIPSEESVKFRLYATLSLLDTNYEQILAIQDYHLGDGFRFSQKSFDRNIEVAKQLVQDVEVVTIGQVLTPFLDERDRINVKEGGVSPRSQD